MVKRPRSNAAKFLRSFGLRPIPRQRLDSQDYYDDICNAGIDPWDIDIFGDFSPQAGSVYFASARVARTTLSVEFHRLEETMTYLDSFLNSQPHLTEITDLGGGAGMISLYLASRFPDSQFHVYDHSLQPLEYGATWADERLIENVWFDALSYQELAESPPFVQTADLVLFNHAIPLVLPNPKTGESSLDIRKCRGLDPSPSDDLMFAVQAIHKLLEEGGRAIVTCHFSAWGLIQFCEACRLTGLGIEWPLCFHAQRKADKCSNWYLVLRKGMPHLTDNSYEDARAVLKLEPIVNGVSLPPETIDRGDFELQSESLLADGSGVNTNGQHQRARLWEHEGTLIVSIDGPNADAYSIQGDFGQLAGMMHIIHERLQDWQSEGREVESWYVHPALARFREFVNQHPS